MRVNYGVTKKQPRKKIYTKKVTLMFDERTLNEFKTIVGDGYQVKIRELVNMYINAYHRKMNDKE